MQKLFVLLRQDNFKEFKKIISDKPELIESISGPKPKKDHGQSLLQVALKTGKLDFAEYLIKAGIDVNYMEPEDDDPGVRAPVLFDAITAVLMSLCVTEHDGLRERIAKFRKSDHALALMKKMIDMGADVTKRTSNNLSAVNWALHHASNVMDRPDVYTYSQEKVRKQLTSILDCLFENGVDCTVWLEEGYYPEPCPGASVRETFWCDLEAVKVKNERYMSMREYLHKYFEKKKMTIS